MKANVVGLTAVIVIAAVNTAHAASGTVVMNSIDANGVAKKLGTLELSDTKTGLQIKPRLTDLPAGRAWIACPRQSGLWSRQRSKWPAPAAGIAAGGHYDPANTGKHLGPQREGHKGDMPVLTVETGGKATKPVTAPHLALADVKGRSSTVIHAGGDNYSDQPAPLGGGGARIACGVVK